MKNVSFTGLFLLGLVSVFFFVNVSEAIIQCSQVDMKAASCVLFATGKANTPAPACCAGLQQLAQSVKSVDDKKSICRCLKTAVKSFAGVQDKFLSQIPASCKIKVGFPVSLNTNCEM
ncbi:Plant lipid transfer protein/Par allergen [Macleaya cordata]|uniref:Non-specific lipid-transfer protein n=1 Tax=Macleaya cordata TaxID=56857 RepID=A0A200R0V4_MACCD|nr:Plant lipid transfer protein/Par allergen [Macleaya cordata]